MTFTILSVLVLPQSNIIVVYRPHQTNSCIKTMRKNNFIEVRFPTDISFGSLGGPEYKTSIVENQFGVESRNIISEQPRHVYNISYGIKNQIHMDKLIAFFHNCMGRAVGFRFKDWNDYKIEKQLIGTGDGRNSSFQICKEYTIGKEYSHFRKITKPVAGTLKIHKFEYKKDYECDYKTGIITFIKPPKLGEEIIVSTEFDIPVRFDVDNIFTTIVDKNLREMELINLVEVKL